MITKNKVKDKYIRKNIITNVATVFLRTINQIRVRISSSRNFRLNENRLCSVWLSGPLDWPWRKIVRAEAVIRLKKNIRTTRSE